MKFLENEFDQQKMNKIAKKMHISEKANINKVLRKMESYTLGNYNTKWCYTYQSCDNMYIFQFFF